MKPLASSTLHSHTPIQLASSATAAKQGKIAGEVVIYDRLNPTNDEQKLSKTTPCFIEQQRTECHKDQFTQYSKGSAEPGSESNEIENFSGKLYKTGPKAKDLKWDALYKLVLARFNTISDETDQIFQQMQNLANLPMLQTETHVQYLSEGLIAILQVPCSSAELQVVLEKLYDAISDECGTMFSTIGAIKGIFERILYCMDDMTFLNNAITFKQLECAYKFRRKMTTCACKYFSSNITRSLQIGISNYCRRKKTLTLRGCNKGTLDNFFKKIHSYMKGIQCNSQDNLCINLTEFTKNALCDILLQDFEKVARGRTPLFEVIKSLMAFAKSKGISATEFSTGLTFFINATHDPKELRAMLIYLEEKIKMEIEKNTSMDLVLFKSFYETISISANKMRAVNIEIDLLHLKAATAKVNSDDSASSIDRNKQLLFDVDEVRMLALDLKLHKNLASLMNERSWSPPGWSSSINVLSDKQHTGGTPTNITLKLEHLFNRIIPHNELLQNVQEKYPSSAVNSETPFIEALAALLTKITPNSSVVGSATALAKRNELLMTAVMFADAIAQSRNIPIHDALYRVTTFLPSHMLTQSGSTIDFAGLKRIILIYQDIHKHFIHKEDPVGYPSFTKVLTQIALHLSVFENPDELKNLLSTAITFARILAKATNISFATTLDLVADLVGLGSLNYNSPTWISDFHAILENYKHYFTTLISNKTISKQSTQEDLHQHFHCLSFLDKQSHDLVNRHLNLDHENTRSIMSALNTLMIETIDISLVPNNTSIVADRTSLLAKSFILADKLAASTKISFHDILLFITNIFKVYAHIKNTPQWLNDFQSIVEAYQELVNTLIETGTISVQSTQEDLAIHFSTLHSVVTTARNIHTIAACSFSHALRLMLTAHTQLANREITIKEHAKILSQYEALVGEPLQEIGKQYLQSDAPGTAAVVTALATLLAKITGDIAPSEDDQVLKDRKQLFKTVLNFARTITDATQLPIENTLCLVTKFLESHTSTTSTAPSLSHLQAIIEKSHEMFTKSLEFDAPARSKENLRVLLNVEYES